MTTSQITAEEFVQLLREGMPSVADAGHEDAPVALVVMTYSRPTGEGPVRTDAG